MLKVGGDMFEDEPIPRMILDEIKPKHGGGRLISRKRFKVSTKVVDHQPGSTTQGKWVPKIPNPRPAPEANPKEVYLLPSIMDVGSRSIRENHD